jgi:hypothetical protein
VRGALADARRRRPELKLHPLARIGAGYGRSAYKPAAAAAGGDPDGAGGGGGGEGAAAAGGAGGSSYKAKRLVFGRSPVHAWGLFAGGCLGAALCASGVCLRVGAWVQPCARLGLACISYPPPPPPHPGTAAAPQPSPSARSSL